MNIPITHIDIGNNDTAIYNTVKIMANVVNESSSNYKVRKFVEKILENKYDGVFNEEKIVNIIYSYIIKNTKYLYDIEGIELIKSPLLIIDELESGFKPQLDCDDYTVFSLSLLKSVGFPVAIRIIASNGTKEYDHVYGLVKINKQWTPIDCTLHMDVGYEYHSPNRIADYEILSYSNKLFKGLRESISEQDYLIIDKVYTFKTKYNGWLQPRKESINLQDLLLYMGTTNVKSISISDRPLFSSEWYFYIIPRISKQPSFFTNKLIEGLKYQGYDFSSIDVDGEKLEVPTTSTKVITAAGEAVSATTKKLLDPLTTSISKPLYPLAIIAGSIAAIYVLMNIRAFSLPSSK